MPFGCRAFGAWRRRCSLKWHMRPLRSSRCSTPAAQPGCHRTGDQWHAHAGTRLRSVHPSSWQHSNSLPALLIFRLSQAGAFVSSTLHCLRADRGCGDRERSGHASRGTLCSAQTCRSLLRSSRPLSSWLGLAHKHPCCRCRSDTDPDECDACTVRTVRTLRRAGLGAHHCDRMEPRRRLAVYSIAEPAAEALGRRFGHLPPQLEGELDSHRGLASGASAAQQQRTCI